MLHQFLLLGRKHIESVSAVQEVHGCEVHRDQCVHQWRREHRDIGDLSNCSDEALSSDGAYMLTNREPGYCEHNQYVYTVETDRLLDVVRGPKGFSLEKCNHQDSNDDKEDMLGGDLDDLFSLVLDIGVIFNEELEHELLL